VFPAWWSCSSFSTSGPETSHCHLKWLLDWIVWACGLPSQVIGPHTIGLPPMGLHEKPWVTHRQLILKKILLPVSLRQQQPSGRSLAMLRTQDSLCFVVIGYVLRLGSAHRSICSKLVTNSVLFRLLQWFCLVRPT
jgi:hypothetical protein